MLNPTNNSIRDIELKKNECLKEMSLAKDRILKELSGVDKITLTRLRQVLDDYNNIDYNVNNKVNTIETFTKELNKRSEENVKKFEDSLNIINMLSDFVTPELFGARGDGVTNDSLAFKKAFNLGKTVLLTKKYYIDVLEHDGDINIIGNNTSIIGTLKVNGSLKISDCNLIQNSDSNYLLYVNGNLFIDNCKLTCDFKIKESCISIVNSNYSVIHKCECRNNKGRMGISIQSSDNVSVENCWIENIGSSGIQIFDICKNIKIDNNTLINCNYYIEGIPGEPGLEASDGCISTYGDTTFTGTTSSENISITNNRIINEEVKEGIIGVTSIRINGVKNGLVENNYIVNSYFVGILVANRTHEVDNVIYEVHNENVIVKNNTVNSIGENASIFVYSGNNIKIIDNHCTNYCNTDFEFEVLRIGNMVLTPQNVYISGNTLIAENGINCRAILIYAGSKCIIKDNYCKCGRGIRSSAEKLWVLNNVIHNQHHNFIVQVHQGSLYMKDNIYSFKGVTGSIVIDENVNVVYNDNNFSDNLMN
jgi:hypothetical protein